MEETHILSNFESLSARELDLYIINLNRNFHCHNRQKIVNLIHNYFYFFDFHATIWLAGYVIKRMRPLGRDFKHNYLCILKSVLEGAFLRSNIKFFIPEREETSNESCINGRGFR